MTGAQTTETGSSNSRADAEARAFEARRLHKRQMVRRGLVTAFVLGIVAALTLVAMPVGNHIRSSWILGASGYSVDWQIDADNWKEGGVTEVSFKRQGSFSNSSDSDLALLQSLLNVESVNLAESSLTEKGLTELRKLPRLKSLNLSRMLQLQHSYYPKGLDDSCLVSLQGLTRLENLTLSGNRITDAGLALIGGLPGLENLDLYATDVSDAGLVYLRSLKRLKTVSLGGTHATLEGVRALQRDMPGLEVSMEIDPEVEKAVKELRRADR